MDIANLIHVNGSRGYHMAISRGMNVGMVTWDSRGYLVDIANLIHMIVSRGYHVTLSHKLDMYTKC